MHLLLLLLPALAFAQSEPCFEPSEVLNTSAYDGRVDGEHVVVFFRSITVDASAGADVRDHGDRLFEAIRNQGFRAPRGSDDWLLPIAIDDVPGSSVGGFTGSEPCAGEQLPWIVLDVQTVLGDELPQILAQELFHATQQEYAYEELWDGPSDNLWIREATAGHIEGRVAFHAARRERQALRWMSNPGRSITTHDASGVQYGTFLFFEHLTDTLGHTWHLEFWARIDELEGWDALTVLNGVLQDEGTSLDAEWSAFLIAISAGEVAGIAVDIPVDSPADMPALVTRDDLPWFTSTLDNPTWPEAWGIGAIKAQADEGGTLFAGFEADTPWFIVMNGEARTGLSLGKWGEDPTEVWFLASPPQADTTFSLSLSTGCACQQGSSGAFGLLPLLLLARRRYPRRV